jgi:uncharacterized protein HemX
MAASTAAVALTVGALAAGSAGSQYAASRKQEKLQKRALNQAQDIANREEARQLKQEQAITATESRALKQEQAALAGLRQGRGSRRSLLSGAETGLRNLLG